jgi:hypothetical protein
MCYREGMRKTASKNGRRKSVTKKEERPVSELGRRLEILRQKNVASGAKPLTVEDVQRENLHRW